MISISKNSQVRRSGRATSQAFTNTTNSTLLTVNGKGILKRVGLANLSVSTSQISLWIDGVQQWGSTPSTGQGSLAQLVASGTFVTQDGQLNIPFNSSFQIQGLVGSGTGILATAYELD